MELQIIGRKSCNETRRAERFFKERDIPYQFKDLKEQDVSEGELKNICSQVDPAELIDQDSKAYKKGGYAYLEYDPFEELLENQGLLKTPIVRYKKKVAVGRDEQQWKQLAEELS